MRENQRRRRRKVHGVYIASVNNVLRSKRTSICTIVYGANLHLSESPSLHLSEFPSLRTSVSILSASLHLSQSPSFPISLSTYIHLSEIRMANYIQSARIFRSTAITQHSDYRAKHKSVRMIITAYYTASVQTKRPPNNIA